MQYDFCVTSSYVRHVSAGCPALISSFTGSCRKQGKAQDSTSALSHSSRILLGCVLITRCRVRKVSSAPVACAPLSACRCNSGVKPPALSQRQTGNVGRPSTEKLSNFSLTQKEADVQVITVATSNQITNGTIR